MQPSRTHILGSGALILAFVASVLLLGTVWSAVPSTQRETRVLRASQVVQYLDRSPRLWEGRVVLVRGLFLPAFTQRSSAPLGALVDSFGDNRALILTVKQSQAHMLSLVAAVYRVRLYIGRDSAHRWPAGYLIARVA